ncbi:MAG: AtpZ/AtpI family protein [Nitrospirae bacterium]|nr:AtpZ/AtpI family protein [Nitrospirota bacterium]
MKEEEKNLLKTIAMLSTLGLTLVFATMIGLAIGIYLDKKFHTSPWLTIIFLLIGIAAGFKSLIQTVIRQAKKENNGTGKKAS